MSTKAEQFRAEQQRTHRPKTKRALQSQRNAPAGTPKAAERNRSRRAGKKGGAELEVTRSGGKPSRKSTRKSQGRVKRTDNLRRKALRKAGSATAKAAGAASRRR